MAYDPNEARDKGKFSKFQGVLGKSGFSLPSVSHPIEQTSGVTSPSSKSSSFDKPRDLSKGSPVVRPQQDESYQVGSQTPVPHPSWSKKYDANAKFSFTSPEDYTKITDNLKREVQGASVFVRTSPSIVHKIAADGRIKTQFETNTSGAAGLDPELRARRELQFFSYPKDMDPKLRPVYGYLSKRQDGSVNLGRSSKPFDLKDPADRSSMLDLYGNVGLKLKGSVNSRTTFNVGDSLDQTNIEDESNYATLHPTPLSNPSHQSVSLDSSDYVNHASPLDPERGPNGQLPQVHYYEAQIHHGVSLSDIQSVHVPQYLPQSDRDGLRALAQKHGFGYHEH